MPRGKPQLNQIHTLIIRIIANSNNKKRPHDALSKSLMQTPRVLPYLDAVAAYLHTKEVL